VSSLTKQPQGGFIAALSFAGVHLPPESSRAALGQNWPAEYDSTPHPVPRWRTQSIQRFAIPRPGEKRVPGASLPTGFGAVRKRDIFLVLRIGEGVSYSESAKAFSDVPSGCVAMRSAVEGSDWPDQRYSLIREPLWPALLLPRGTACRASSCSPP
jgi:hypothetical protein